MPTLKREPDDARLPLLTPGEWVVEGCQKTKTGKRLFFIGSDHDGKMIPMAAVAEGEHVDSAEGNALTFAASKDMLGHLYGLLCNFPKLGKKHSGFSPEEAMAIACWVDDQAGDIRDTLKKAGVRL